MLHLITAADLLCPCCKTGTPHHNLIEGLNFMQTILGIDLTIGSGCRCPKHNAEVGGAPNSAHLTGEAADVTAPNRPPLTLYFAADQVTAFHTGGIGLYPFNAIHVDVRHHTARWFRITGKDHPITEYLTRAHAS